LEIALDDSSVTVIPTYEDLARNLRQILSTAQSEVFLASRYYEPAIGSILFAKFSEGVKLHLLDSNSSGTSLEKRLRMASTYDTKNRDLILKMLDTPDLFAHVERLDYSFIVVDGKKCGVELVNPANPDNFSCALKLENENLARELVKIFHGLAESRGESKTSNTPTQFLTEATEVAEI
jgi:hypothetical protein